MNQQARPEITVRHMRTYDLTGHPENRGGLTLAYRVTETGVEYAAAYCSPRDNFNRGVGRTAAVGRLHSEKHVRKLDMPVEAFEIHLDAVSETYHISNRSLLSELSERIEIDVPAAYLGSGM